jgi:cell wall-associated NlpC family hydrolase
MAEKNLGDLRAKFKVDVDQMDKLANGIKSVKADFAYLKNNLGTINTELKKTLDYLREISGLGGLTGTSSGGKAAAGAVKLPMTVNGDRADGVSVSGTGSNTITNNINFPAMYKEPPTGGGGGVPAIGGKGMLAARGMQYLSTTIDAMNQRMDNNYARSLSADKLGVYYQQQQGISQTQYINMRQEMTGQRLGYGGISTLLTMQAQTGLSASGNAAGFAGLRALSGYSIGTDQLAQQAATLAGPAANNRLTMMLGTGMYGLGGQQRSMDKVMQQIVQRTGLTNEGRLAGARQAGSNTRAMLMASGVPEDMIDQILDYANANIQYQKKTGKTTMYDPSKEQDRQVMGIEKSFATQAEETARVREGRDENYYKRQADNLAQMEENTQKVTKALGLLEERLSGIVGANISSRNSMFRKLTGYGMIAAGGLMTVGTLGGGAPLGLTLAGLGTNLLSTSPSGDPVTGDKTKGVNIPFKNGQIPLADLVNSPEFSPLNSSFKTRLLKMFEDNPNVGLADGHRSEEDQKALFLSRYTESENGDVSWNGKRYRHVSGAPVAPPGTSMHELGLAADLTGDLDWVEKNAAKYGLKSFGGSHGEPWHVQPAELPKTRAEYQAGLNAVQSAGTTSVAQQIQTTNLKSLLDDGIAGGAGVAGKQSMLGATNAPTPSTGTAPGISKLETVATNKAEAFVNQALKAQGDTYELNTARDLSNPDPDKFDCSGLVVWAAKQSGYEAPGFGNTNADGLLKYTEKTGGALSPEDAKKKKGALLFRKDGEAPAHHVAISLGDGTTMEAKGTKEGVGIFPERNTWNFGGELPGMFAAVGDPVSNEPTRGSTNVQVAGNTSVTIAPNIYVTSTGNNPSDARRMAEEIARLLDNDLKRELLRTI